MAKAKPINVATKIRIAKHKEKHPDISITNISELFNVSYEQARRSIIDYKKGKYSRPGERGKCKKAKDIMEESSPDEIFESQFHLSLALLESEASIGAIDRINALEKIAKIRKSNQSIELERHLKRADAGVVAAIVRRYEPEATNERIIVVYREEFEKLKVEN